MSRSASALYLHIPFCSRKCGYCDFNAYSGYKDGTKARYVEALCREIAAAGEGSALQTIFFGGGTPTNLEAPALVQILSTVKSHFTVASDAEISLEANPSDADLPYLETLRAAGFNRISFGVQTFNDSLLKLIDREHSGEAARQAIVHARAAGFENLSLDLMFGLPRQTVSDFERTLETALTLDIPHLSIYGLIVEEGTPFFARRERGKLPLPEESAEAAMFSRALEKTQAAGLARYEISNYARPGFACRHNRVYWRNEPYFGLGAGATGYLDGVRRVNIRRPSAYIDAALAGRELALETETLSAEETMGETMMLGLRLVEGVSLNDFAARFGVRAEQHWAPTIAELVAQGLLEHTPTHLRLTEPKGLFLASEAMAKFI
ncbi:radical SAM family heme chaperone HemW [Armatimonas rosea]|uniref:Heme chaperone HemW n=1 Tax=Armatimonas rosea TaxID=685828 RepID=A0A7W9SSL4_ARMRO|nr:radical SAM family heme chaperone HemW [Armatimonas rosea]MBB6051488.1 oxygen-independent coproporphyrinogen-3 oxidase [Armatimonas rosea]